MLKNLFLPEKIGSYYLFSKRILGFDIGKTHITATQVLVYGRSVVIESITTETLPQGTAPDYHDRVASVLKRIAEKTKYDTVSTALPASVALFKELTLPFTNRDKIKLVLGYEIESLLPFSLDQAVIDFIITDTHEDTTTVLAAVVRKAQLAEHLALFEAAGITPETVTIDLFSLYGLYKEVPDYRSLTDNRVVASIGFSSTKMAYLVQGKLTLIRTIPHGITTLVKHIGSTLNISAQEAHEQLMRFGFEAGDGDYAWAARKALDTFLTPFMFTLRSFAKETQTTVDHIVLLGGGAQIKDCTTVFEQATDVPASLFSIDSLVSHDQIRIKDNHHVPSTALISLSAALPTPINELFNLGAQELIIAQESRTFMKQFIIGSALVILILGTMIGNAFFQVRKLSSSIAQSEKQLFKTIEQTLNIRPPKRVEYAVDEAQRRVEEQERTWFSFTAQTRSSFLNQLQALSQHIDKKSLDLQLKKLLFTHDTIRMQGEVKDIPSLVILEEELKQTNLGSVTSPQEPKFTITITLKKKSMEG